ncbi:MAG: hypothetical protein MHM6MM_002461 [Cercozoa sp. M6MM]
MSARQLFSSIARSLSQEVTQNVAFSSVGTQEQRQIRRAEVDALRLLKALERQVTARGERSPQQTEGARQRLVQLRKLVNELQHVEAQREREAERTLLDEDDVSLMTQKLRVLEAVLCLAADCGAGEARFGARQLPSLRREYDVASQKPRPSMRPQEESVILEHRGARAKRVQRQLFASSTDTAEIEKDSDSDSVDKTESKHSKDDWRQWRKDYRTRRKTAAGNVQGEEDEALVADLVSHSSALRDAVHSIRTQLQQDAVVRDEITAETMRIEDQLKRANTSLSEYSARRCSLDCWTLLLLLVSIVMFIGTYLLIRLIPKPAS